MYFILKMLAFNCNLLEAVCFIKNEAKNHTADTSSNNYGNQSYYTNVSLTFLEKNINQCTD